MPDFPSISSLYKEPKPPHPITTTSSESYKPQTSSTFLGRDVTNKSSTNLNSGRITETATNAFSAWNIFVKIQGLQYRVMNYIFSSSPIEVAFDSLFNDPKHLLEVLTKDDKKVEFSSERSRPKKSIKIVKDHDQDILSCMNILAKRYAFPWNKLKWKIKSLIECDCAKSIAFVAKEHKNMNRSERKEYVEDALNFDSADCFEIFLKEWEDAPPARSMNECHFLQIGQLAARAGATNCLSILARKKLTDRESMQIANEFKGYPEIVCAVLKNDTEMTANLLFSDLNKIRKNWLANKGETENVMRRCLARILRFTSIENTEKFFQCYSKQCTQDEAKILMEIYLKIKGEILLLLPFISRHNKPKDVKEIRSQYNPESEKALDITVEQDLLYAQSCRQYVTQLLEALQNHQLEFEPNSQFKDLPPSAKKSKNVALLLEKIALFRAQKQIERGAPNAELFMTLRIEGYKTPVAWQYEWGTPLIRSVYHFSKSAVITKQKKFLSYDIYYDQYKTNEVILKSKKVDRKWRHGFAKIEETWPFIEDLFEDLMNRDLSSPKEQTPEALEDYKQRLDHFYSSMAIFFGCIGNTQPLYRGSGTVSEFLFAMLHMKHGLKIPILKPDFPQFDVLNITFPSDDYAAFFTYFFEPQSLPEHATVPKGPTDAPMYAQMEALYA